MASTLTSTARNYNQRGPRDLNSLGALNQSGMSLLEILVGLSLISIVVIAATNFTLRSDKDILLEAVDELDRGIRFASDESVLRNSIVRVNILPDREPAEFAVEFGPPDAFVLPEFAADQESENNLSLKELEERQKQFTKLGKSFSKVPEFQEENKKLPEKVKILGVGSSLRSMFVTDTEVALYVYPTGERDDAIIVLSAGEELAVLEVKPFEQEIKRQFVPLPASTDNLEELQQTMAMEIYEKWKQK